MKNFDLIVFDWDGTLVDSTAHIAASIQNAFADNDLPVPNDDAARHVIGLGLVDTFNYLSLISRKRSTMALLIDTNIIF